MVADAYLILLKLFREINHEAVVSLKGLYDNDGRKWKLQYRNGCYMPFRV